MRWLGTILLAAPLAWLAAGWVARQRASRRARRLAELEGRIESLDVLGFLGRHDEVAPLLEAVVRDAAGMAGAGGAAARARSGSCARTWPRRSEGRPRRAPTSRVRSPRPGPPRRMRRASCTRGSRQASACWRRPRTATRTCSATARAPWRAKAR